ncbi:nucleotidyltransferase domain-containing protein [Longimicrobium sp.]|uniref:nucleotidyltransferase domain-containing protein n=1 Tax=Longimicrobium sp. TaxID=2029185 RepID=UPI002BE34DF9|nr:hypothetical protein [Longimicrobium sp.]HSU14965.1 hypothetical protein [Longimicrobium sp.]
MSAHLSLPPAVAAAAHALRDLRAPWAIAGGWAIDLALGRVTRAHGDVDIAMFRRDQAALRAALPGWTFEAMREGAGVPWSAGEWLELPAHEIHARPASGDTAGGLEILLNERDEESWIYRRDPAVRRPIARALRMLPSGVTVLAPEIVLLYKSKAPRATDEHDFAVAQEVMDGEARAWLRAAIARRAPEHPWAATLARDA